MTEHPIEHSDSAAAPRRRFFDGGFIVVAAILVLAAIGLNATVAQLKLTFRKERVELQKPLKELPAKLGPWIQATVDERLPHEEEDELATLEYISRDYVDSRIVPAEVIAEFSGKRHAEQRKLLGQVAARWPKAVIHLHIPYYTGLVDTVAHVPDRCFVASGFAPGASDLKRWSCFDQRGDQRAAARFTRYEDQVSRRREPARDVAYFFHVNGRYTNDSLDVRASLQDLFEKYGYYAKIELMTVVDNRDDAALVMDDFLNHALPEVEKVLPDWQKIKSGAGAAGK